MEVPQIIQLDGIFHYKPWFLGYEVTPFMDPRIFLPLHMQLLAGSDSPHQGKGWPMAVCLAAVQHHPRGTSSTRRHQLHPGGRRMWSRRARACLEHVGGGPRFDSLGCSKWDAVNQGEEDLQLAKDVFCRFWTGHFWHQWMVNIHLESFVYLDHLDSFGSEWGALLEASELLRSHPNSFFSWMCIPGIA